MVNQAFWGPACVTRLVEGVACGTEDCRGEHRKEQQVWAIWAQAGVLLKSLSLKILEWPSRPPLRSTMGVCSRWDPSYLVTHRRRGASGGVDTSGFPGESTSYPLGGTFIHGSATSQVVPALASHWRLAPSPGGWRNPGQGGQRSPLVGPAMAAPPRSAGNGLSSVTGIRLCSSHAPIRGSGGALEASCV